MPPFANDSGSAIGAACCALVSRGGFAPLDWKIFSGPDIRIGQLPAEWISRPFTINKLAALLWASDEPAVVLNGRSEIGPRALGNRSILASPVNAAMKDRLNSIKGREAYRPIAPICLESRGKCRSA